MRLAALACLALLSACGSRGPSGPQPLADQPLDRSERAGRLALELERPEEALAQYRAALARARARDDAAAIGDNGYNLAVVELRLDRPRDSLATAQTIRAELGRRGVTPFPALLLAEAAAQYRLGRRDAADALAAEVARGDDADAALRAWFLRGLIADDRGDAATLAAAEAALAPSQEFGFRADREELAARLALRRGDAAGARAGAMRTSELRRDTLDFRGIARALGLAADAARAEGDTAGAADLYLRAGRAAAEQNDTTAARGWLDRALLLSRDPALTAAARQARASLAAR